MNQLITVIGGDGRYLELIKQLQSLPHTTVHLVGFDKIEKGFTGLTQMDMTDVDPTKIDVVILPITGIDQHGIVEIVFSDQVIQLTEEWFNQLKKSAIIFTGIANDFLLSTTKKANLTLIPLLDRDDVAIYNSIPTAEGTMMMAMEHTDYTLHGSRVVVVGFGRVGHTIANKFQALGAKVSVSAKNIGDLARINEMGLSPIPLTRLHEFASDFDLLINTIPAKVVTKQTIQQLPSHSIIIDLASAPGGTDFAYAKQRGIKAILAKSLPGTVAPKTAGKILADVIIQLLLDKNTIEHQ